MSTWTIGSERSNRIQAKVKVKVKANAKAKAQTCARLVDVWMLTGWMDAYVLSIHQLVDA